MSFAKFPSAWLGKADNCPLKDLEWRKYRTQATAALILLMALSIRLNQAQRGRQRGEKRLTKVSVTYDDLRAMTGFARATISKGLMLLQGMGAIAIDNESRASVYELNGVETPGCFCQLPQSYLLWNSNDELRRLRQLPTKFRVGLNAMKLYVLMLKYRNQAYNTTAIGYEAIMKHTGMRREDIPEAMGMLSALELARASDDSDPREHDKSKRYRIIGLTNLVVSRPDRD
jgi:hypothetical protein